MQITEVIRKESVKDEVTGEVYEKEIKETILAPAPTRRMNRAERRARMAQVKKQVARFKKVINAKLARQKAAAKRNQPSKVKKEPEDGQVQ